LATVYYHIVFDEKRLDEHHDSEMNVLAQVKICKDERVRDFIDLNNNESIVYLHQLM
jgi:hypothetical protein